MTSDPEPANLSGQLPAAYRSAWELFVDWCTTVGHEPVPAVASVVQAFLEECPAAPATQALRIRAITAAHTRALQTPPARTPAILDILRGRHRRPNSRIPLPPGHVDQLLAVLPIHGWTGGWFGRRDRALLVLSDTGLPYRTLARLTVADVAVRPDGVRIRHAGARPPLDLSAGADPTRCRPCALVLWIDALLMAARGATITVARAIEEAPPLTSCTSHQCEQRLTSSDDALPLLPASTAWGHLDVQPVALSPRSVSRLARVQEPAQHRHHPPQPVGIPALTPPPLQPPVTPALKRLDPTQAAARRRATVAALAPLTATLDRLDQAAAELERRTNELLGQLAP